MMTKVLGGGIAVLVVLLVFVYWQKENAETRADQLEQQNATLAQTAEDNAAVADELRAEMTAQGKRLAAHERARERLRAELRATQDHLTTAMEAGDEQVQECRGTPLPDDVVGGLRNNADHQASDGEGDGRRQPH